MPEISRFHGVVIRMYFNDHSPAHFHAQYAEYIAEIDIEDLDVSAGSLPRRTLALVVVWAIEHQAELIEDWQRARRQEDLLPIAPLP